MHYVYILQKEENRELYYGYTINLERRFKEHAKHRKSKLVYYEAYLSEKDARLREKKLKHYGQSRAHIKNRIENSLA